jgi:hypothetical protein
LGVWKPDAKHFMPRDTSAVLLIVSELYIEPWKLAPEFVRKYFKFLGSYIERIDGFQQNYWGIFLGHNFSCLLSTGRARRRQAGG